jgi:hypothetical protein
LNYAKIAAVYFIKVQRNPINEFFNEWLVGLFFTAKRMIRVGE